METLNEFQKYCVKIYLRNHVSELHELTEIRQAWWKLGQKIYNENKLK